MKHLAVVRLPVVPRATYMLSSSTMDSDGMYQEQQTTFANPTEAGTELQKFPKTSFVSFDRNTKYSNANIVFISCLYKKRIMSFKQFYKMNMVSSSPTNGRVELTFPGL